MIGQVSALTNLKNNIQKERGRPEVKGLSQISRQTEHNATTLQKQLLLQEEGKEQAGAQSTQICYHYTLPETKARQNWKHPPVPLLFLSM